jgi:uncharacterized membrane protein
LTALNSGLLVFIAALPFPTSVLGLYSSAPIAVALYAATLTAIGLLLFGIRTYALSRGLLRHRKVPRDLRTDTLRSLLFPAVFAASVPIAYAGSPSLAMYFWLLLIPLNFLMNRFGRAAQHDRQRAARPPNGVEPSEPQGRGRIDG